ncbi:MAG: hypothetical protein M0035_18520 [Actinomycetota bacterium]|nr:hypothetical protein [Actinomycetota bacterium]
MPASFIPVDQLCGRPHVVVDGAPRPGTSYTLSHWPGTPTPPLLRADLSAETALRALEQPGLLPSPLGAVTVDHYDADGIVALAMLVLPGLAETAGARLVEVARVGDFGVVTDEGAALVAFALDALGVETDPARRALELLPGLLAEPEAFERLWGAEHAAYAASLQMMDSGAATLEELPEHDLAVVRVRQRNASARWGDQPLHLAAVNSATGCLRVATISEPHGSMDGGRLRSYEVRFRYESWVRLESTCPRPRVDLAGLARTLTSIEPDGAPWSFEGAGALRATLRSNPTSGSAIGEERFMEELLGALAALDKGPAAWDPYA